MLKIIFTIFGAFVIITFLALPQFGGVLVNLGLYIQNFNGAIAPIVSPEVAFFLILCVLMFVAAIFSVITNKK